MAASLGAGPGQSRGEFSVLVLILVLLLGPVELVPLLLALTVAGLIAAVRAAAR